MIVKSMGPMRHRWILATVLALCLALPAKAIEVSLEGGLDEALRSDLEGGSLLFEQAQSETEVSPQELVSTAQADYKRLLAVLYDYGYYGAVIRISLDGREAASIKSVAPPRSVSRARIRIAPGSQFRFGKAEIAPLVPGTKVPEGFRLGETARLSVLRDVVAAGVGAWRDEGHAKARLESQKVTARHADKTIDASLRLDPGPRLRFGNLNVTGNTAVRTERIVEIAGLPAGTVYSPKELEDAAARLRRTGTFSSVAMIEAEEVGPGDALGITARVVEDKPRRFGFGGEISTIEGLSVSAFWIHRNLFGGAERLRLEAEIDGIGGETGGTDFLLGARYQRPATFNEDTELYVLGEVEQLDEVNFFSRQATIGTGIERIASDNRQYRAGIALRRANTRDAFGENNYALLMFPLGTTFDYRDKTLDARRGYFAKADVTPFAAIDGADNGILTSVDLRGYRTFGQERPTTIALRGQLGSLIGPALSVAPADFLFYSGGGDTVRGHDYQSLGVDLGGGQIVGGRSFIGLSAEIRMRTTGNLGYVGFFDAGYIGREVFPDGSGEWQTGAGVGLRYDTPIGPIRLDVGVPTSGDDDNTSFQVYIGIGQAF
ncbi:autotransporter assembly complex protein TamA [Roseobacter sp. YSTF-M11]|uniref:Autotransporter assembly complex protein TamA n=1 Tax=Roseobacter insulae TaxID=2859783 RepID=A0A9X1G0H7_9RHOB|nr:autotransporter assembly complex family protein [Roseobacter insulae]MBW4710674.1 autotransporter assembly complex protein TamA [Roseobacter insulae]